MFLTPPPTPLHPATGSATARSYKDGGFVNRAVTVLFTKSLDYLLPTCSETLLLFTA